MYPNTRTEEINQMLRARQEGLSYAAIGRVHDISRQRVQQLLSKIYNGYQEVIRQRANDCCEVCRRSEVDNGRELSHHHKELIVEGYNKPDNILLVCIPCHRKLHAERIKPINNSFGKQLRIARILNELRQDEVATMVGISQNYIAQLERGRYLPAQDLQDRLKEATGWFPAIAELVNGETESPSGNAAQEEA